MRLPEPDANLVPLDARVLAAVSGGADSLALLWWLKSTGRNVVAGHVNHGLEELRHGDCDRDEAFVRQRCNDWDIPLLSTTVQLPRKQGHVNEEVARESRYEALTAMAASAECSLLATAHTATDGLETALLNLVRGAGVRGLTGIPPRRELTANLTVVRPFWQLPRRATREILKTAGWDWREDESNNSPLFSRNRIRHEVLPLLEEISGRDLDILARHHAATGQISRDDLDFLEEQARALLPSVTRRQTESLIVLDGARLLLLPVAMRRRCLRAALRDFFGPGAEGGFAVTEHMLTWAEAGGRRKVWCRPKGVRVEWTGSGSGNLFRLWRA